MNAFVLALALAALALAQRLWLKWAGLRGVTYTRRFSRFTAYEGEEVELVEVLRNDRPVFIPWLRAESRMSPFLRFGQEDNLAISGERYHKSVFTLRPYQQITRRHRVRLTHRGVFDVGHVSLTFGDLFGVCDSGTALYTPAEIVVYPRLLPQDEVPLPVSRMQGELIVRRHALADPFLINGIRAYQRGDQRRDIHWPATARTGTLQVKTHDFTADTRLLVVINAQLTESQWGELMDYEQPVIERAIALAATACVQALRGGVAAGFAANMPLGEEKGPAMLLPQGGCAREEELLSAMAHLRILRVRSFNTFLEDLAFLRGTDILLLSAYTSPALEERLHRLRALGNTVTLQLIGKEAQPS